MNCLVYVSSATQHFSETDLIALLKQSRANNTARGLSGMLLHSDGNFMQALEGDIASIDALQATITADPRHRRVTTVLKMPITERRFADWSMGFATLDEIPEADRPGYQNFFASAFEPGAADQHFVLRLLDGFRERARS